MIKSYLRLIRECQNCIVAIRLDYINSAWKSVKRILAGITELMNQAGGTYDETKLMSFATELMDILSEINDAQKQRDQCKIANVIEESVLPWLSEKLETASITSETEYLNNNLDALKKMGQSFLAEKIAGYTVPVQNEHIKCSFNNYGDILFDYIDETGISCLTGHLHPFMDALYYAYDMRKNEKISYTLGGGCMIYEAIAFMTISIATEIYILEEDVEFLFKIFKYIDLKDHILSGRLIFVYQDLLREVAGPIANNTLLVKSASLKGIINPELRKAYSTYQMIIVSAREEGYLLFKNYAENAKEDTRNIGEIMEDFQGKNIYLIAGGPSLNKSIDILRSRPDDSRIICVGTSAKKLLTEGINPEYVIISDPLPTMEKYLNQPFDYKKTSLLFLATTWSGAVQKFLGARYIVYQFGFPKSEEAAAKEGMPIFETGGSVTTLALDIALNTKAAHIYCMGCDMAYTYNQMHVSGVDDKDDVPVDFENRRVRGVNGDTLETAQNLDSYRKWIEKHLRDYHGNIPLTNISDGAYIEGMENISCQEAMERLVRY